MRRFLGWSPKPSKPLESLDPNQSQPDRPLAQTKPTERTPKTAAGLGLGLVVPDHSDEAKPVHFDPNPTVLQQQSFEPNAPAANFSRSASDEPSGVQSEARASDAREQHRSKSTTQAGTGTPLFAASSRGAPSPYSAAPQTRTTSPLSFSHSSLGSGAGSPYAYSSGHPSLGRLNERDPTLFYQPITWSELAHPELVDNVSARERTRQEILWEVVASEERYVLELRSLVDLYVNPLLHPQLNSTSKSPYSLPASSTPELPIASRFLRSSASSSNGHNSPVDEQGRLSVWCESPILEILSDHSRPNTRSPSPIPRPAVAGRHSLPPIPHDSERSKGSRLASFGFRSLKAAPSSSKPQRSPKNVAQEFANPPPVPPALSELLLAVEKMLKGHEELAGKLKQQWARAFPLVRGLAGIWSDQDWFLRDYSQYILNLEESLAILDELAPSTPPSSSGGVFGGFKSGRAAKLDGDQKKLANFVNELEDRARLAGESSLSICISKPLMRLGKLPLLMQNLLFHTDGVAFEWEQTRAMALEVVALVRSIEDEKVDEEEREKMRDVMARIESIRDRSLMAPRSPRTLVDETPAPASPPNKLKPRRSMSDAAGGQHSSVKPKSAEDQWLIRFSDVTIRCQRIGQTDIPGGFSRQKERQGKQGKLKKGKLRNLYKFIRVERWEMRKAASLGAVSMDDIHRLQNGPDALHEFSDEELDEDDDEVESRLSFHYEGDDPRPAVERRQFTNDWRSPTPNAATRRAKSAQAQYRSQSAIGHSSAAAAATKGGSFDALKQEAKFGRRLRDDSLASGGARRVTSPTLGSSAGHGFDRPTKSSLAKSVSAGASRAKMSSDELPQPIPPRPGTPGPGRRAMSAGPHNPDSVPFPSR